MRLPKILRSRPLPPPWEEQRDEFTKRGVTLTLEEARHCQQAFLWLATTLHFDDAFGRSFVPAAETLAKLTRELGDPEAADTTAVLIAEADRAALGIENINRSQHQ